MEKLIKEICDEIRKMKCPSCGGKYEGHTCIYCGFENENLKELEEKLQDLLRNCKNIDNSILINLYFIKDLNIPLVNEILNNGKVNEYMNNICTAFLEGKSISNDELNVIVDLLDFPDIDHTLKVKLINELMKQLMLKKIELSPEKQKKIIINLAKTYMEYKVSNPKVIYDKLEEKTAGVSLYNYIWLDEKTIEEFIETKNYIALLELVFHECTHTFQKYCLTKKENMSYLLLQEAKEMIISNHSNTYYKDNYRLYTEEVEARIMGMRETINYLSILNLKVSNLSIFQNRLLNEEKNLSNKTRIFEGKESTVDEIFESIEITEEEFTRFPILSVQYKYENGKLMRKTKEELEYEYSKVDSNNKQLIFLYETLINEYEQIKKA